MQVPAPALSVKAPATPGGGSTQLYTMEEVEQHDSKESCWFVVDGKVYDATPFLKEHPGGSKEGVLFACLSVWWEGGAGRLLCGGRPGT